MSEDVEVREVVRIELTNDQALVLFDWLARFNQGEGAFEDPAEERVLWDIEATLEQVLVEPFLQDYRRRLAEARAAVRDTSR